MANSDIENKNKTKDDSADIGVDVSLLQRLLDEKNDENIILFDEDGNEIELEQIAVVTYEKVLYAILRPVTAAEDEAVVFKIDADDEESITIVDDEELADKVLDIYHKQCGL